MGLISKVVDTLVDTYLLISTNVYPEYDREARAIFPPGFEGWPIKDDQGLIIEIGGSGKTGFLGVYPVTTNGIAKGEVRIYSRDANGNIKAFVLCKADGTIIMNADTDNAVRFSELKTAYDTLRDDFNNFVTTTYNLHNHPTAPSGPISPPSIIGTSSSGNVDNAKIDEIKVP